MALQSGTVKVTGLRQLERAIVESNVELNLFLREGLLALAEPVARDIRSRYAPYSQQGAAGVKAKVTKPGNALVAQTLRKSRSPLRRRRNFGGLMMRTAFLPALDAHKHEIEAGFEALLTDIAARNW